MSQGVNTEVRTRFSETLTENHTPSPADLATGVGVDDDLSWSEGLGVDLHEVFFGTVEQDVIDGTGGTSQGTQSGTTFDPGTLSSGTHYWRVANLGSQTLLDGETWEFEVEVTDVPKIDTATVVELDPVTGTVVESAVVTGAVTELDVITGTVVPLDITGDVVPIEEVTGSVAVVNELTGSVAALNEVTGAVSEIGPIVATVVGSDVVSGTVAETNPLTGTVAETNAVTGTVVEC